MTIPADETRDEAPTLKAVLVVNHPSRSARSIAAGLGLEPISEATTGDPMHVPEGRPPQATADRHCAFLLARRAPVAALHEAFASLLGVVASKRAFLAVLAGEGGTSGLTVSMTSVHGGGFFVTRAQFADLAAAGVELFVMFSPTAVEATGFGRG